MNLGLKTIAFISLQFRCPASWIGVLQGQNQGDGRDACLPGNSKEEFASKLIHIMSCSVTCGYRTEIPDPC